MQDKSTLLDKYIDSGYTPRPKRNMRPGQKGVEPELTPEQREAQYQKLKDHHAKAIHMLTPLLKSTDCMPPIGAKVWAVQDLTPIGRGIFLGQYCVNEHGFVYMHDDDDPHGFITHWVDLDTLNQSNIPVEKLLE